jgi:hypothetical protein
MFLYEDHQRQRVLPRAPNSESGEEKRNMQRRNHGDDSGVFQCILKRLRGALLALEGKVFSEICYPSRLACALVVRISCPPLTENSAGAGVCV